MINKQIIHKLMRDLDLVLSREGEKLEIIIFGSGALLLQNIASRDRTTVDIEVLEPALNNKIQLLTAEVGEKYGLSIGWMNSAGNIFSRGLPKNWQARSVIVFDAKALKVLSLCRPDLIASKFKACCVRNLKSDIEDLHALNPSSEDFNYAIKWIAESNDSELIQRAEKFRNEFMGQNYK